MEDDQFLGIGKMESKELGFVREALEVMQVTNILTQSSSGSKRSHVT